MEIVHFVCIAGSKAAGAMGYVHGVAPLGVFLAGVRFCDL